AGVGVGAAAGVGGRAVHDCEGERIAVHVAAGEHDGRRGVLVHHHALVVGHGRVVERRDGQTHGCWNAVGGAVVDQERDRVGPVEVGVGGVGQHGKSTRQAASHAAGWYAVD